MRKKRSEPKVPTSEVSTDQNVAPPTWATAYQFFELPKQVQFFHEPWPVPVARSNYPSDSVALRQAETLQGVTYLFRATSGFDASPYGGNFQAGDTVFFNGVPRLGALDEANTYLVCKEYDLGDGPTKLAIQALIQSIKLPGKIVSSTPPSTLDGCFIFVDFPDKVGTDPFACLAKLTQYTESDGSTKTGTCSARRSRPPIRPEPSRPCTSTAPRTPNRTTAVGRSPPTRRSTPSRCRIFTTQNWDAASAGR